MNLGSNAEHLVEQLKSINDDLRRSYNNLWIEHREYSEMMERELDRFESRECPECNDWPDYYEKHCPVCGGNRVIYTKED